MPSPGSAPPQPSQDIGAQAKASAPFPYLLALCVWTGCGGAAPAASDPAPPPVGCEFLGDAVFGHVRVNASRGLGVALQMTGVRAAVRLLPESVRIEGITPITFVGTAPDAFAFALRRIRLGEHAWVAENAAFSVSRGTAPHRASARFDDALELELDCASIGIGAAPNPPSYESIADAPEYVVAGRVAIRESARDSSATIGWVGRESEEVVVRAVVARDSLDATEHWMHVGFYFRGARVDGYVERASMRPAPAREACEFPCFDPNSISAMFSAGPPSSFERKRLVLLRGGRLYSSSSARESWGVLSDRADAVAFGLEHGRYRIDGATTRRTCGSPGCGTSEARWRVVAPLAPRLRSVEESEHEMWIEENDVVVVGPER